MVSPTVMEVSEVSVAELMASDVEASFERMVVTEDIISMVVGRHSIIVVAIEVVSRWRVVDLEAGLQGLALALPAKATATTVAASV